MSQIIMQLSGTIDEFYYQLIFYLINQILTGSPKPKYIQFKMTEKISQSSYLRNEYRE